MTETMRLDFQVLMYREDEFWIAHCLETDLVGEGATADEAVRTLVDISNVQVQAAIESGDLASIFSPAPPELWRLFATALDSPSVVKPNGNLPLNRLSVRQLALA